MTVTPSQTSSSASASEKETPSICLTADDFYTPEARALARRHLAPFLEEHQTTPLELLHSASLQTALGVHPVCSSAIDAVADLQAPARKQSTANRARELRGLFDRLAEDTVRAHRQSPPTLVTPEQLVALVNKNGGACVGQIPAVDFPIQSALTATLLSHRDRQSKMTFLMDALEATEFSPAAQSYLDAHLAEHLASRGVLKGIWSTTDNPRDFALDLLSLYHSKPFEHPQMQTAMSHRLEHLFSAYPLPLCRNALIVIVQSILETADRLVKTVQNDLLGQKLMMAELSGTAEIAKQLQQTAGFLGGKRTHELLDRRLAFLISTDKLQELTRGRSVMEKLQDLFSLQDSLHGITNTKTIDDYIVYLLEGRDFMGRLCDSMDVFEDRLRAVSTLQLLIINSAFPTSQRKQLATLMDGIQHDLIKTTTLFTSLRKETKPPMTSILHVVDLAGQGAFTHGKCLAEARELVRRHVRHKDFLRKYLHRKDPSTATGKEGNDDVPIGDRLRQLAQKMAAAGIEFRDLSTLRVLVTDDEDSARDYVVMVLRDMGIQTVLTATDGREALKTFSDAPETLDLIICDWKMPHTSGLEVLKHVRAARPTLPFLMVTALATLENVQEAMTHNVTAYIAKPFPPEQLEEKVLLLVNRASGE